MKSVNVAGGLITMHFEDAAQPVFVEKKGKDYVYYGEKNDYPDYLLYLYNNSAKHSAIINGKVDYVCGKGWAVSQEVGADAGEPSVTRAERFITRANKSGESLDEVTAKAELDIEVFNGAYLQVCWGRNKQIADIYHIDYTSVRSNKDNTEFYVSDEWVKYNPDGSYKTNNNPEYKKVPAFNPLNPVGTQILYVKKYHPGIDIYTLPTYRGSITWIEVDIEIGNYHLNNVKSGFFVNKLINFNNGKPTTDEQGKIEKMLDAKFGGVRGRKYMLSFNADSTKAATVEDLNVSESDKLFDQLNKTTQQEIFTGHRITSPMLFGIKTEGQLGGRTEMRESFEAFQNTYVNSRQQWLEKVFNMLAMHAGVQVPLAIQRSEPISFEFSEATQAQNMTQEEIRDRMGLAPLEKKENSQAQDTINAINSLSQVLATKVLETLTADELRSLIGRPPVSSLGHGTAQFSAAQDEEDATVFESAGTPRAELRIISSKSVRFKDDNEEALHFAEASSSVTELQAKVLDVLTKDPLAPNDVIAEVVGESVDIVAQTIASLEEDGMLKIKGKTVRGEAVTERKPTAGARDAVKAADPETRSVQILYSYEGPEDERNRPFCAKMLKLDRLYSRKEIEAISKRLEYSVWARRGGWYTIPGTNEHRPYCRHSWASNVVVKRK